MEENKLKIGFLASHGGSNMQAIIDSCMYGKLEAIPAVLISNNSNSGAIQKAKAIKMPAYHVSSLQYPNENELAEEIIRIFSLHSVQLICLAGYMKKLPTLVIQKFTPNILNIHPALLPKYGGEGMYGMNVHIAVHAAKEAESGASIHIVSDEYDRGRVINQKRVKLSDNETPESIASKVLEIEHILYSETIAKIISGDIKL